MFFLLSLPAERDRNKRETADDVGFAIQIIRFMLTLRRVKGLCGEAYRKIELRALKAAICRAKRVIAA